jgi:hypothetical protein
VAVFDNDATLWSVKPIPIQLDFTLFRMAELAGRDRSVRHRQPYKAAVEQDYRWLGDAVVKHYHGDDADLRLLKAAVESAFEGMGVEAFGTEVLGWLSTASHPVLHRPYLAIPTATSRCSGSRGRAIGARCGCLCCTTTPSASSPTPRAPKTLLTVPRPKAGRSSASRTTGEPSSRTGEDAGAPGDYFWSMRTRLPDGSRTAQSRGPHG